jgi:hypothetical protein
LEFKPVGYLLDLLEEFFILYKQFGIDAYYLDNLFDVFFGNLITGFEDNNISTLMSLSSL